MSAYTAALISAGVCTLIGICIGVLLGLNHRYNQRRKFEAYKASKTRKRPR